MMVTLVWVVVVLLVAGIVWWTVRSNKKIKGMKVEVKEPPHPAP
jgi:hypothetical protein